MEQRVVEEVVEEEAVVVIIVFKVELRGRSIASAWSRVSPVAK